MEEGLAVREIPLYISARYLTARSLIKVIAAFVEVVVYSCVATR